MQGRQGAIGVQSPHPRGPGPRARLGTRGCRQVSAAGRAGSPREKGRRAAHLRRPLGRVLHHRLAEAVVHVGRHGPRAAPSRAPRLRAPPGRLLAGDAGAGPRAGNSGRAGPRGRPASRSASRPRAPLRAGRCGARGPLPPRSPPRLSPGCCAGPRPPTAAASPRAAPPPGRPPWAPARPGPGTRLAPLGERTPERVRGRGRGRGARPERVGSGGSLLGLRLFSACAAAAAEPLLREEAASGACCFVLQPW